MKDKILPYPILRNIALLQLPNENLYLHIFSHFKKFRPFAFNEWTAKVQTIAFQAKLPNQCVLSLQYGYEIFQNVYPALQNYIPKNI